MGLDVFIRLDAGVEPGRPSRGKMRPEFGDGPRSSGGVVSVRVGPFMGQRAPVESVATDGYGRNSTARPSGPSPSAGLWTGIGSGRLSAARAPPATTPQGACAMASDARRQRADPLVMAIVTGDVILNPSWRSTSIRSSILHARAESMAAAAAVRQFLGSADVLVEPDAKLRRPLKDEEPRQGQGNGPPDRMQHRNERGHGAHGEHQGG